MANHATIEIKNPGTWQVSASAKSIFLVLTALGVLTVGAGLAQGHAHRVWANILINHFYFMCLAVGALFFIALQHITNSMWSTPFRRVVEGFTAYLPFAAVFGILLLTLGSHSLYEWTHPDVLSHDSLIASKAAYLNPKAALIRTVLAFSIWIFFAKKLVGNSLAQDISGDSSFTLNNVKWSAVFILLFSLTFSALSIDYVMSLEAHWFSTMWAVYCFADRKSVV